MKKVLAISTIITTVLFLLLPWLSFANKGEREFLGLTTTLGINLYIGTGMILSYDDSALSNSAIKWEVDPKNNAIDLIDTSSMDSSIEKNEVLVNKSLEIWTARPVKQTMYSIDKILIAFGLKANNLLGYAFGIFNSIAILSSIIIAKQRKFRNWGFAILTSSILLALQAAAFQADRRFIVSIFIPFGIIAIALAYASISKISLQEK
jgi:branched-subunit amino acid transport protein AzlD